MSRQEMNVLCIIKDSGERFVFLYDDASHQKLLETLGKYAADPELNFSWYDASILSQRARKLKEDQDNKPVNRIVDVPDREKPA